MKREKGREREERLETSLSRKPFEYKRRETVERESEKRKTCGEV